MNLRRLQRRKKSDELRRKQEREVGTQLTHQTERKKIAERDRAGATQVPPNISPVESPNILPPYLLDARTSEFRVVYRSG
jgi:hypothetical protein